MNLLKKYNIPLKGIKDGFHLFRNDEEYFESRTIIANELVKDLNRNNYKIISLGYDCYVHDITKAYGLKLQIHEGELAHPFDECTIKFNSISKILNEDFIDLCNPKYLSNGQNIKYMMGFPHHNLLFDNVTHHIKFRMEYLKRVANFYSDIYSGKNIFFINHNNCGSIEKLFKYSKDIIDVLRIKFNDKVNYKFIMINNTIISPPPCFEGIRNVYMYIQYPDDIFQWYTNAHVKTDVGMEFCLTNIELIKNFIIANCH